MPILTILDGIPLFSTQQEAVAYAEANYGILGFHTHVFNNQTGYMPGSSHDQILVATMINIPYTPPVTNVPSTNTQQTTIQVNTTSTPSTGSGGSSGGASGGGGGGY